MKRTLIVVACLTLGAIMLAAQNLVISNARVIAGPGQVIEKGSIVIKAGRIVSIPI